MIFWITVCQILQIKMKLSTAFHPQTDGQSEAANKEMERYLRSYVSYQQEDWGKWLSLAKFAENANISATTGVSPFFANYGYEPRMEFDISKITAPESARERIQQSHAKDIAERISAAWDQLKMKICDLQG